MQNPHWLLCHAIQLFSANILKKYCSERGYRPPTLDSDCRGSGLCKVPLRVRLKLTWHTYFTQKEATVRLFFSSKMLSSIACHTIPERNDLCDISELPPWSLKFFVCLDSMIFQNIVISSSFISIPWRSMSSSIYGSTGYWQKWTHSGFYHSGAAE